MPASTPPAAPLRVLVVDDHPLFRVGVVATLNHEPGIAVCAEAADVGTALALAAQHQPEAAIVDLMLNDEDGLKLVRDLRKEHPRLRIVALSMLDAGVYAPKALQAGASFFVSKQEGPAAIVAALRRAAANERESPGSAVPMAELSERELQVFLQLGLGRSTQEIAVALGVSAKTIESHREAIKAKLHLPHANALVARAALWARTQGLVS